jgi:hypothetical protein
MAISRYATSDSLAEAQADITATRTDVASVKTDVGAVRTDVSGVKTDVASTRTDVAGVKADVAATRQDIAGVQTTLAALAAAQIPRAFSGQIELFRGPLPAGWSRISGLAVPQGLFGVSRVTLASYNVNPGNISLSNSTTAAWCVNADGQLHCVQGGSNGIHRSYDPGTDAWTQRAASPVSSYTTFQVIRSGSKLYVLNAMSGTSVLALVYAYDPAADTWTSVAANPSPRQFGRGCMLSDGKILLIGGYTSGVSQSASTMTTTVQVFDPVANTYVQKSAAPVQMAYVRAVPMSDGRVFVTPSQTSDGTSIQSTSKRCWLYTPAFDTWQEVDALPAEINAGYIQYGFYSPTADGRVIHVPGATPSSGTYGRIFDPAAAAGSQWTSFNIALAAGATNITISGSVNFGANPDGMTLSNGLVPAVVSFGGNATFALVSLGNLPTYSSDLYYAIKNAQ